MSILARRAGLTVGALLAFLPMGLAVQCAPDTSVDWVRFNGDDFVRVGITDGDIEPARSTELTSTTGAVTLGVATVDPGAAPAGTEHTVEVQIDDEWQEIIGKVSVGVNSGERGFEVFPLTQDSADHGYWFLELRSVGDEGEVRSDRFNFRLFQLEVADEPVDTGDDG